MPRRWKFAIRNALDARTAPLERVALRGRVHAASAAIGGNGHVAATAVRAMANGIATSDGRSAWTLGAAIGGIAAPLRWWRVSASWERGAGVADFAADIVSNAASASRV